MIGPLLSVVHQARRLYWRALEPSILGVRALILREGHVMLVRHTYQPGLYLPGGKVERGETGHGAMCREVAEECALVVQRARLAGIYSNREINRNDQILLYCVEEFTPGPRSFHQGLEIAEAAFFPLDALPADTTPGTHRRLREHAAGRFDDEYW